LIQTLTSLPKSQAGGPLLVDCQLLPTSGRNDWRCTRNKFFLIWKRPRCFTFGCVFSVGSLKTRCTTAPLVRSQWTGKSAQLSCEWELPLTAADNSSVMKQRYVCYPNHPPGCLPQVECYHPSSPGPERPNILAICLFKIWKYTGYIFMVYCSALPVSQTV